MFRQRGAVGMASILGLVFIALGVVVGATFVPTTVDSLVDARASTGITSAAQSMTDIGQLVAVIALTIGPPIAGLYVIFKDIRS